MLLTMATMWLLSLYFFLLFTTTGQSRACTLGVCSGFLPTGEFFQATLASCCSGGISWVSCRLFKASQDTFGFDWALCKSKLIDSNIDFTACLKVTNHSSSVSWFQSGTHFTLPFTSRSWHLSVNQTEGPDRVVGPSPCSRRRKFTEQFEVSSQVEAKEKGKYCVILTYSL